jgi:alpha-L-fucosidase 2
MGDVWRFEPPENYLSKFETVLMRNMFGLKTALCALLFGLWSSLPLSAQDRVYEIWEPVPAPNRGATYEVTMARGVPFDTDWESWSYPIGNGYMGANIFGRLDTERIQIADKTLHNRGVYNRGGITNFVELYLDLDHEDPKNYKRSINLNEGIAYVTYEIDGVRYTREYFANYPSNVLVVRLSASEPGALSFSVYKQSPHADDPERRDEREDHISSEGDLITMEGSNPFFGINFESQLKVIPEGGTLEASEAHPGALRVSNADSAVMILALGTNYELNPGVFLNSQFEKVDPTQFPHEAVTQRLAEAHGMGYEKLREEHLADYQNLFGRVQLHLSPGVLDKPTHGVLGEYQEMQTVANRNTYIEELIFHYGRYLLISSSRENTLPANLQGVWSQYDYTPWTGGYWHNINVQMNYWGAMSTNLAETFVPYINFYKAYLPAAERAATEYISETHPHRVSKEPGGNGWIIGTGANAFSFPPPGGHSGPGTGGMTSKLLIEYYNFTQDEDFLREVAYPSVLSLSRFFSKTLTRQGEHLLVYPSASPEQRVTDTRQVEGMPGSLHGSRNHYITIGCTFDQGFVWENFNDTLKAAEALGAEDPFLEVIREQKTQLDPILIGADGQIKEYREETFYSDIGDPTHRHISHLCPLFPGTLINSSKPEWMEAASKALDFRGLNTTGWGLMHRMSSRARLKEGGEAHRALGALLDNKTGPNLWMRHPPYQIDANLGVVAGIAEMLLQSHEGCIEPIPALPVYWDAGSFAGLVARGNFVVSAEWSDLRLDAMTIESRKGGVCTVRYPGSAEWTVIDSSGREIELVKAGPDQFSFPSQEGETYTCVIPEA